MVFTSPGPPPHTMTVPPASPPTILDVDLAAPPRDLVGLGDAEAIRLLLRWRGAPLGYVAATVRRGRTESSAIAAAEDADIALRLIGAAARDALRRPLPPDRPIPDVGDLLASPPPAPNAESAPPLITVAVCTRDRPDDITRCLAALAALDYPAYEVLVVDNAPSDDATRTAVAAFPGVRYACEPRPGLDWARNRAVAEARGEIIAFADDDVQPDADWLRVMADVFAESPTIAAVTGLVVPASLATEAERLFEAYGGFGRGWVRAWYERDPLDPPGTIFHHGAGRFGTGANMAFRRWVFERIGLFDPALDVGTASDGGGDLEMYFRVLQEGLVLVYEPRAVIRHQHRTTVAGLRRQLRSWGTGLNAYMLCAEERYPAERPAFAKLRRWWWTEYAARRLAKRALGRGGLAPTLITEEIRGAVGSTRKYRAAVERARALAADVRYGPPPGAGVFPAAPRGEPGAAPPANPGLAVAVRTVELTEPIAAIEPVDGYGAVRVFFCIDDRPVGVETFPLRGKAIEAVRVRDAAAEALARNIAQQEGANLVAAVRPWVQYGSAAHASRRPAAPPVPGTVSVIVATYDRPDDLRACLQSLVAQRVERPVEIIVVDNNPASGRTAPVVAEFPGVVRCDERRAGLSYARNAGVRRATGDFLMMTDDDVVTPPRWIERAIAPFADPAVMGVTGNVLPLRLDTPAQRAFERYGGLGRGFVRRSFGREWLAEHRGPAPTWDIGATANATFRAAMFADPAFGLLDEALGAGTPTGVGEDTDLFYRVLRAGWQVVYEPSAYVWHKHRRDWGALRNQLYNYSRGHVAYHLTVWQRYGDRRGLRHFAVALPAWHLRNLAKVLVGRRDFPASLTLLELGGNLAGPWGLYQSRRRTRRLATPTDPQAIPARGAPARDAGTDDRGAGEDAVASGA